MRRFSRLDVQRDLFGQWCFIREWGRRGRAGQVRMVPYATAAEAHETVALQQRVKERSRLSRPVNREGFTPTPLSITIRRPEDRMEGFLSCGVVMCAHCPRTLGISTRRLGKKSSRGTARHGKHHRASQGGGLGRRLLRGSCPRRAGDDRGVQCQCRIA
jgi:predicted DNA-binding WGR domain protein